jgi:hypothetical protein
MGDYGDKLRKERRLELAVRTLPTDSFNEYGEVSFATKTENGKAFPAKDYAYVPDADMPSTWKLRLTSTPGGSPDPQIVGAALAALGKGFRGNKVQIPEADLARVKMKVKAAWLKANPEKSKEDIPAVVACGDHGESLKFSVKVNEVSATPSDELGASVAHLISAARTAYTGYEVKCDVYVDVADDSEGERELSLYKNGISQTPSEAIKENFETFVTAVKSTYGDKFDVDVHIKIKSMDEEPAVAESPVAVPSYGYDTDGVEELGTLPPALKAQLVKKLESQLAKEKDPKEKAKIQAKIDSYS